MGEQPNHPCRIDPMAQQKKNPKKLYKSGTGTDHNMSSSTALGSQGDEQLFSQLKAPYNQNFDGSEEHGTCYAYAVATAVRAAQLRLNAKLKNKEDIEAHKKIRNELIKKFGDDGATADEALEYACNFGKRNLKWANIGVKDVDAKAVFDQGRVVLLWFFLDDGQWNDFSNFFAKRPTETLTAKDIRAKKGTESGHAVCIIGYNAKTDAWKIKNSWGTKDAADRGYYRVQAGALPDCEFYDLGYKGNM